MDLKEMIFTLSEAAGPSGDETGAADAAAELLRPYVDSVTRDVMGNLVGIRCCKKRGAKCVLLDAHLDEVCLRVTGHDRGFLKFTAVGIDPRLLPGLEVRVLSQPPVYGVVTCLPPHVLTQQEREKPFEADRLYIDCGMTSDEAEKNVPVGIYAVYATRPFLMGDKLICGKALDDRACFAVLVRTMELLQSHTLPVDVCVLGSLQEESTGMGARVGCFNLMPDYGIAVDVTFGDTPDSPREQTFPLGGGPTVGFGPTLNRRMSLELMQTAQEQQIPCTREVLEGNTGTNSMQMQICREGIAAACVSLPLRYMHTPIEAVHLDDVENTARLLAQYILTLGEEAND